MKKNTIVAAMMAALVASLLSVSAAVAWHVETSCELIEYDGYEYKVMTTDYDLVQDWTSEDTAVAAGTYIVKFRNGEKRKYTIDPCPRSSLNVVVRGMLCGDPRASWKFVNKGDIPATFRWSWLPGNKSITTRKHQVVTVAPGASRKILHRWVRGWVAMRVYDPGLGRYVALSDASYRVGKTLESSWWGTNGCPSGLLAGSPDFRKAHVIDRYSRVFTTAR